MSSLFVFHQATLKNWQFANFTLNFLFMWFDVMRKLRLVEKFFQTNCAAEIFIRLFVMNVLNMPQQNSLYFKLGLTIWTGKIVTNSVHSFYVVFYSVRCLYPLEQESHPKLRSWVCKDIVCLLQSFLSKNSFGQYWQVNRFS